MGLLQDLQAELLQARQVLSPQIEGLHDFARLNLKPETLTSVQAAMTDFERRLSLIEAALAALKNLADDQYPDVPQRDVLAGIYADLRDNVSSIEAAFSKFNALGEAVTVVITPGTPVEKS